MRKKYLVILTALVLILSLFAACTKNEEGDAATNTTVAETEANTATEAIEATEEVLEDYNVQVLVLPTNVKNTVDTVVGKAIYDIFKINFELISYAGDQREKQNLMLAAGDYNEMQYMQRADIVKNYINAGALLPLDEYLADMPNFTARYVDIIPYWRLNSEDGMLYNWETYVPRNLDTDIEVNDMMIRTDALETAGWEMPVSADEWVAFLQEVVPQMKDADGNPVVGLTLPMAEAWGLAGVVPIMYEKGDTYQAASNEAFTFNLKTEQFEDYFKAPPVKESFKFFNDLYQAGLLDEECFTDTLDKTVEKLKKGSSLSAFYIVWKQNDVNAGLSETGNEDMQYISLPIQTNDQVANGEKREIRVEASRPYNSWGLTINCKQPERLLELIDYCSSDEGQILLQSGVEGIDWKMENGERVPMDNLIKAAQDPVFNETQGINGNYGMPMFNLLAADGQPHGLTKTQAFIDSKGLTDRQKEAFESLGWASSKSWYLDNGFFASSGMSTAVYIDPASELGKTGVQMTELRKHYSTKLIMAESDDEFEAIWNEAMEAYEKLGPQEYIDEMNRLLSIQAAKLEEYRNK